MNIANFLLTAFFTEHLRCIMYTEYTVYILDLLKDYYNCFLLSLIEKHLYK